MVIFGGEGDVNLYYTDTCSIILVRGILIVIL